MLPFIVNFVENFSKGLQSWIYLKKSKRTEVR
jgi:hypothetical protein